ncbi:AbrB/MazE/SpoVT family DNA-binding domain-containing protein [Aneurinibacillus sp. BA2021]|nr:AbrB/MazE/SpoVT family DNA-binding domain-containing protein [Aneurinibacillus sp. BA2021]
MRKKSQVEMKEDGSVLLPTELMQQVGIRPGDFIEFEVMGDGAVSIELCRHPDAQALHQEEGMNRRHVMQRVAEKKGSYVRTNNKSVENSE